MENEKGGKWRTVHFSAQGIEFLPEP